MSHDAFNRAAMNRRSFMLRAGCGLGAVSLGELMGSLTASAAPQAGPEANVGQLAEPHFEAKAKRVIFIHILGAMSQADTFDYKPMLERMHGQQMPPSVMAGRRLSTMVGGQTAFPVVGPVSGFGQHGQSGAWVSDLLPYTSEIVDDLCFIKSMNTDQVNHDPASKFLHTGFQLPGRPSEGAWVSYALGSNNKDLPAFVVMESGSGAEVPNDIANYGAGFAPSQYQGVKFRPGENPVAYVTNPDGVGRDSRTDMLDVVSTLARDQYQVSSDPDVLSRVIQYEMAYRMQNSVPELADISDEPQSVLDMYGDDVQTPGSFARNALLARRLMERDVRFVELFDMGWDFHADIELMMGIKCQSIDQGVAALVKDLKQRGMLDDTLVIFATEFGRTSFAQGILTSNYGRDHHGGNYVFWLAGAGVKPGITYGASDDFSYNIAENPVSVHDFSATMLHLLGIDHERLTFRYQGRDFRLTDISGRVVNEILA